MALFHQSQSWESIKSNFFDRDKVTDSMDRATVRAMNRQGGFIRTFARRSIRRRKTISKPGNPPHAHSGEIKLIFYAWDPQSRTAVIGPIPFQSKRHGESVVPKLLEFGGDIEVKDKRGPRVLHYRARPFMRPAEEASRDKFAGQFQGEMK